MNSSELQDSKKHHSLAAATSSSSSSEEEDEQNLLFECAELILSWLSPPDLASASSTCKTLHRISKSITTTRSSDASRTFENIPIPFVNTFDSQPYSYFLYTPSQIPPLPSSSSSAISQPWGSYANPEKSLSKPRVFLVCGSAQIGGSSCGCVCDGDCCSGEEDGEIECPCLRFRVELEMMMECGPSCSCGLDCENRLTQRGISVRLRVVKDEKKGWGLYAGQFLKQGQFICEYAGELLTTEEARRRQNKYDELASGGCFASALLVVREHLPSRKACLRINIDATRIGNVARFINHSCDGGNLSTVLVRSSGALLPRLCFFASKDIHEGEELTFSYGDVRLRPNGLQCFCGSSNCCGFLPSELT